MLSLEAFLALLVSNVRTLASAYPDGKYIRPSEDDVIAVGVQPVGTGCYYVAGVVMDGPCSLGCIMGQAIGNMPEEYRILLKEGKDINGNIDSAYGGCYNVRTEMDENPDIWKMYHWASDVQMLQDDGATWGEAVNKADKAYYS